MAESPSSPADDETSRQDDGESPKANDDGAAARSGRHRLDAPRGQLRTQRRLRGAAMHSVRVAMFAAILALIHDEHRRHLADVAGRLETPVSMDDVRPFLPEAAEIGPRTPQYGGRDLFDEAGERIGLLIQTSPEGDRAVGYAGPTGSLVVFDREHRVVGVNLLHSSDTREHVDQVVGDERFMSAWNGKPWEEAAAIDVDAVSGATLTSLAVVDSIRLRLGGASPSARFPDGVHVDELRRLFPAVHSFKPREKHPHWFQVTDDAGREIGSFIRTSPAADDMVGYQGPTDSLLAFGPDERVAGLIVRSSFDNEPYVGYIRDDSYFRELFNGRSIEEISKLDPQAERIEGVSGATMTSQAVAASLAPTAQAAMTPVEIRPRVEFAARDAGTLLVLGTGVLFAFTRLRGWRWSRTAFQVVLVVYFGFLNGDLLSQSLAVGWAQSGAPWRLAPGLVLLAAASVALPVATRRNVYCHHVCPFGAAQALLRNRLPWRLRLTPRVSSVLSIVPALLIALVVATAIERWPVRLAWLEPFDAFLPRIAGAATLVLFAAGLIASAFSPMAYCRFGCPTGATLNYLRRHADSARWSARDTTAALLLVAAAALRAL